MKIIINHIINKYENATMSTALTLQIYFDIGTVFQSKSKLVFVESSLLEPVCYSPALRQFMFWVNLEQVGAHWPINCSQTKLEAIILVLSVFLCNFSSAAFDFSSSKMG